MNKIVVVGSINADLITVTEKIPRVGETVKGEESTILPGGKGANQAICAAKLGADVQMIGCIGSDFNGNFLMSWGRLKESTARGFLPRESSFRRNRLDKGVISFMGLSLKLSFSSFLSCVRGSMSRIELPLRFSSFKFVKY